MSRKGYFRGISSIRAESEKTEGETMTEVAVKGRG